MPNRQRKSKIRRSNTRRTYKSGGSTRGNLGTNGVQLSNNPSKLNRGGRIRKMEHGGMHNNMNDGCPPGMHMMPDGTCMEGDFHGQLSGGQNGQPVNQTPSTGGGMGGSGYHRGGRIKRRIPTRRTGGPIKRRRR